MSHKSRASAAPFTSEEQSPWQRMLAFGQRAGGVAHREGRLAETPARDVDLSQTLSTLTGSPRCDPLRPGRECCPQEMLGFAGVVGESLPLRHSLRIHEAFLVLAPKAYFNTISSFAKSPPIARYWSDRNAISAKSASASWPRSSLLRTNPAE